MQIHHVSPLAVRRRPGPTAIAAERASPDHALGEAAKVLDLVERGVLPGTAPPPLPVEVDRNGKPRRPLTLADEQALSILIATWGSIAARDALVLANIGLCARWTAGYRGTVWGEEIKSEALMGLFRAAESYDGSLGLRFSTYAGWWIRAKTRRAWSQLSRHDRPEMHGLGYEHNDVGQIIRTRSSTVSFDMPIGEPSNIDGMTLADMIPAELPSADDLAHRARVDTRVRRLVTECARKHGIGALIADLRLLADEPATLQEIATIVGTSREWVRQIEARVLADVRVRLGDLI